MNFINVADYLMNKFSIESGAEMDTDKANTIWSTILSKRSDDLFIEEVNTLDHYGAAASFDVIDTSKNLLRVIRNMATAEKTFIAMHELTHYMQSKSRELSQYFTIELDYVPVDILGRVETVATLSMLIVGLAYGLYDISMVTSHLLHYHGIGWNTLADLDSYWNEAEQYANEVIALIA